MNKEMLLKPILILLMVIIGSLFLIRSLTSGQTIAEYAIENNIPEHAEEISEEKNVELNSNK